MLGTNSTDLGLEWATTCCWVLVPEIVGCKKPEMRELVPFLPPVFGLRPARTLSDACFLLDLHNH